jgi:AcrR family transcriptional regulator
VVATHGYEATRLADVAREAGITKGALSYHFESKEALYLELMDLIASSLGVLVEQALTGADPWLDRLDRLGDSVVRVLGADPDIARLVLRELTDAGPYLIGPGRARIDQILDRVVAFLEEGRAAGLVAPQDTAQLAGTILMIHLGWFGARGLTMRLVRRDPAEAIEVDARARALVAQVRRLCGSPSDR